MDVSLDLILSNARLTLEQLSENARNLKPAMLAISLKMAASINKNFEVGGRYSRAGEIMGGSTKWQAAAAPPVYKRGSKARGVKKGDERGSTLFRSGQLKRSFVAAATNDSASISTNLEYAAIQNFGGKTGRGHRITLVARPIAVIQEEDVDIAKEILTTHLLRSTHS